jgi:hypothetical protein
MNGRQGFGVRTQSAIEIAWFADPRLRPSLLAWKLQYPGTVVE